MLILQTAAANRTQIKQQEDAAIQAQWDGLVRAVHSAVARSYRSVELDVPYTVYARWLDALVSGGYQYTVVSECQHGKTIKVIW